MISRVVPGLAWLGQEGVDAIGMRFGARVCHGVYGQRQLKPCS
jgi:hypothetical protein